MKQPSTYVKAIVGAVLAGLAALTAELAKGHVTATGWITVVVAVIVTFGSIYGVPNSAPSQPANVAGNGVAGYGNPAPLTGIYTDTQPVGPVL